MIGEQRPDEESDEDDFYDAEELLDEAIEDAIKGSMGDEDLGPENSELSGEGGDIKNIDSNKCDSVSNGEMENTAMAEDEQEEDDEVAEAEDYDDDEGWITPANISDVKRSMGLNTVSSDQVSVGCLTTDFAMQVCIL